MRSVGCGTSGREGNVGICLCSRRMFQVVEKPGARLGSGGVDPLQNGRFVAYANTQVEPSSDEFIKLRRFTVSDKLVLDQR